MQVARDCTIVTSDVTGKFYRKVSGTVVNDSVSTAFGSHRCQDISGKTDAFGDIIDHPLLIEHTNRNGAQGMYGSFKNSVSDIKYTNWPTIHAKQTGVAHLDIPELPSINADALRVLANTNPGRNGPGSWGETLGDVGELPKLLHRAGSGIIDGLADGTLLHQFALLPVMEDIQRLKDLQRDIARRLREWESLKKKGGLHRKFQLGCYSATSGPGSLTTFESNHALVQGVVTRNTQVRRWGTVRWRFPPGVSFPPQPPDVLEKWATARVLGLNPDMELIWELIPFSFLFDWWRNVGNWLAAQGRSIPAEPSDVCIMTHTKTTYTMTVTAKTSWVSGGGGVLVRETKRRDIVAGLPPVLSSHGPGLGSGQLSTLAALGNRFRNYSKSIPSS